MTIYEKINNFDNISLDDAIILATNANLDKYWALLVKRSDLPINLAIEIAKKENDPDIWTALFTREDVIALTDFEVEQLAKTHNSEYWWAFYIGRLSMDLNIARQIACKLNNRVVWAGLSTRPDLPLTELYSIASYVQWYIIWGIYLQRPDLALDVAVDTIGETHSLSGDRNDHVLNCLLTRQDFINSPMLYKLTVLKNNCDCDAIKAALTEIIETFNC